VGALLFFVAATGALLIIVVVTVRTPWHRQLIHLHSNPDVLLGTGDV
jgi:hypothetical protein